MDTKSELIKISAELLKNPVPLYVEDLNMPCRIGKRNTHYLGVELGRINEWLKRMAIRIREVADNETTDMSSL